MKGKHMKTSCQNALQILLSTYSWNVLSEIGTTADDALGNDLLDAHWPSLVPNWYSLLVMLSDAQWCSLLLNGACWCSAKLALNETRRRSGIQSDAPWYLVIPSDTEWSLLILSSTRIAHWYRATQVDTLCPEFSATLSCTYSLMIIDIERYLWCTSWLVRTQSEPRAQS